MRQAIQQNRTLIASIAKKHVAITSLDGEALEFALNILNAYPQAPSFQGVDPKAWALNKALLGLDPHTRRRTKLIKKVVSCTQVALVDALQQSVLH